METLATAPHLIWANAVIWKLLVDEVALLSPEAFKRINSNLAALVGHTRNAVQQPNLKDTHAVLDLFHQILNKGDLLAVASEFEKSQDGKRH